MTSLRNIVFTSTILLSVMLFDVPSYPQLLSITALNAFSTSVWDEGETELIRAIRSGHIENVKVLLEEGANPNILVRGHGTALIVATCEGRMDIIDELVRHGANVNLSAPNEGSPLIASVLADDPELAKHFLNLGAYVDAVVPGDETALITAARRGNYEMVKILIETGANPNLSVVEDHTCYTPLSVSQNNYQIRNYLTARGANTMKCL